MSTLVVIGAQWGDEGKGKATDQLGGDVDYVVKFNGGNNAGHTVVIGEETYALHLLPSGILTPGVVSVSGATVRLLDDSSSGADMTVTGFTAGPDAETHASFTNVGTRYFSTLGIPLLAEAADVTPQK